MHSLGKGAVELPRQWSVRSELTRLLLKPHTVDRSGNTRGLQMCNLRSVHRVIILSMGAKLITLVRIFPGFILPTRW